MLHSERQAMRTKKRNLIYALIAFLFLLMILVIAWLVYVILNFQIEPPPAIQHAENFLLPQTTPSGPVSEVRIQIEDGAEKPAEDEAATHATSTADGAAAQGQIPTICEAYGPEIRTRDAFPHPLTYQSIVTPTRVTIILNTKPDAP